MQLKLFFLPSKAIASRITEIFDFVWPTAAAMWNLRWQVQGLIAAHPTIAEPELRGRFIEGSGIIGANLRRACISNTWDQQQAQFAKVLLFEFCALYESWCELISTEISLPGGSKKELQFPTKTRSSRLTGVGSVLAAVQSSKSIVFESSIKPALATNRKYSHAHLEQLLTCYRYFKELRNALIHGSSEAVSKLRIAESDYSALTAGTLGLKQRPEYIALGSNLTPDLSLRGVVGFGEVVLKLICTLDIEFSTTTRAEVDFEKRWKIAHGSSPYSVAKKDSSRKSRISILVRRLGLPDPYVSNDFVAWLRSRSLVFY